MRFGMCIQNTQLQYIPDVAKQGYDYVECRFNLFTTEKPELAEEFARLCKENNIPCETCNCFIPGEMKVTGDEVDEVALRDYVETGMKGFAAMGGKIVVFGSGGARNIPDGFDREKGLAQIAHFMRTIAGPMAEKYGLTIVTEPLCKKASNVLNSVSEVVALTETVAHPSIGSLADLYHMAQEGESVESLLNYNGKIQHSHIAEPLNRQYPALSDDYDYAPFFKNLEAIGCPRCSVEGSTKNFVEDSQASIDVFKSIEF